MNHQDTPPARAPTDVTDVTTPAGKVARDEFDEKAPNAKRHFKSPEMLVADESLTDEEKLALLQDWALELSNRLKAEEEGMSASDPIRDRHEARLADEEGRVRTLLAGLTKEPAGSG